MTFLRKVRKIALVFVLIFMAYQLNSEMRRDDFFVNYNNSIIRLGDPFDKAADAFGSIDFSIFNNKYITLREYRYNDVTIYSSNSQKSIIYGISFTADFFSIIDGIKIGDTKASVLNRLGEPDMKKNNSFYYYNNDFDILELIITYDTKSKITQIRLFMGT